MSIILDAGPSLNFLAVGQENILVQWAVATGAQLAAPERVDREVEGMAKDDRFNRTAVAGTWTKLTSAGRIKVLSDDVTSTLLMEAVERISDQPWAQRMGHRKSLGEVMVLAHASVFAQAGQTVFVLIDEGDGRRLAAQEIRYSRRTGAPGEVRLVGTFDVVQRAGQETGWIKKGRDWKQVYRDMRKFDDALVSLEKALAERAPRA